MAVTSAILVTGCRMMWSTLRPGKDVPQKVPERRARK